MFRTVARSLAFALAVALPALPALAQDWPSKPEVPTLTEGLGMELVVSSPDALQRWTQGEMAKWGKVIKDNNIKLD